MSPLKGHSVTLKTYGIAFMWLVLLTAIELGAVFSHWPHRMLVILILGTAVGKAMVIALFFMHLKFERWIVWLLPGIPVLFAVLFLAGIVPDVVFGLTHLF